MLRPGRFPKLTLDSHMRNRVLMCVLVSLAGCASVGATSGSRGVRFDMSPQEVLARIKPTDTIIAVSGAEIISQGPWDTLPDIRRKTLRSIPANFGASAMITSIAIYIGLLTAMIVHAGIDVVGLYAIRRMTRVPTAAAA